MQGLVLFVAIINSTQYAPLLRNRTRLQHESGGNGSEEESAGGVLASTRDLGLCSRGGGGGLSGSRPGCGGSLGSSDSGSAGDLGGQHGGRRLSLALLAGGLVLAAPGGAVLARADGGLDQTGLASLAGTSAAGAGLAAALLVGQDGELGAVLKDASAVLNDQHTIAGGGLLLALRQRARDIPLIGLGLGGHTLDDSGLVVHTVGAVAAAKDKGDSRVLVTGGIPGDLVSLALGDRLLHISTEGKRL